MNSNFKKETHSLSQQPSTALFHFSVFVSGFVPTGAQKTTASKQENPTEGSESHSFQTGSAPWGLSTRASHKVAFSAKQQISRVSKISIHLYIQSVSKYLLSTNYSLSTGLSA